MKKIYLLSLTLLVGSLSFGQKQVGNVEKTWDRIPASFDRSEDTLNPASFNLACIANGLSLYGVAAPASGYLAGPNTYGDVAKGQKFILNGNANVVGAQVLYGVIEGGNGQTMITAALYNSAQTLLTAATPHNISGIDTTAAGAAGLKDYTFTSTAVSADFYVMVGWLGGTDTFGIVSTTDPCGVDGWEIWSDASWNDIPTAWGADLDLIITALVDDLSYTGIFDTKVENFGVYQADNNLVLTAISEDVYVNEVAIHDMAGRLVKTFPVPAQLSNLSFDISDVNAGNYIIGLRTSNGNFSQKVNIK